MWRCPGVIVPVTAAYTPGSSRCHRPPGAVQWSSVLLGTRQARAWCREMTLCCAWSIRTRRWRSNAVRFGMSTMCHDGLTFQLTGSIRAPWSSGQCPIGANTVAAPMALKRQSGWHRCPVGANRWRWWHIGAKKGGRGRRERGAGSEGRGRRERGRAGAGARGKRGRWGRRGNSLERHGGGVGRGGARRTAQ